MKRPCHPISVRGNGRRDKLEETAMTYDTQLDAEVWAFIRACEAYFPSDVSAVPIDEVRRRHSQMCVEVEPASPEGVSTEDVDANGAPCRVYMAGDPSVTVVFFHGGGFVFGGLDGYDAICSEICLQTGYRVVSVDYRLSPENKHSAAFDDAMSATMWALETFADPIVLAGDSAGGNLAAAVAHATRDRAERIIGQVLIYPFLCLNQMSKSAEEHAHAPQLTLRDVEYYRDVRLSGPYPDDDPTFSPILDTDFSNLPPTVIFTADIDPLRDDGAIYGERLEDAGAQVALFNEQGLPHGYIRARGMSSLAKASFERISLAIEALGQGVWPYA